MSKSKDISLALDARLKQITVANGYLTDIGLRTFRGKRRLALDDVPCVAMIEGADNVQEQSSRVVHVLQRYIFEGHVACDPDNPNDAAHDVIADIKRALFTGDRIANTFGGLVKRIAYVGRTIGGREDGEAVVFASVEIDAEMTEDLAPTA